MRVIFVCLLLALFAADAQAFAPPSAAGSRAAVLRSRIAMKERINTSKELESPKVVSMIELESGKGVYCRCWQSGTFPLCDGAHMKHNEATGDNVGPLIVTVKK